jgi:hypothetical protein
MYVSSGKQPKHQLSVMSASFVCFMISYLCNAAAAAAAVAVLLLISSDYFICSSELLAELDR